MSPRLAAFGGWVIDIVIGASLAAGLYYFLIGPIHLWWFEQIVAWLWRL